MHHNKLKSPSLALNKGNANYLYCINYVKATGWAVVQHNKRRTIALCNHSWTWDA